MDPSAIEQDYQQNLALRHLSKEARQIFLRMTNENPQQRPTAQTLLNHPWFQKIRDLLQDSSSSFNNGVQVFNKGQSVLKTNLKALQTVDSDKFILSSSLIVDKDSQDGNIEKPVEKMTFGKRLKNFFGFRRGNLPVTHVDEE